MARIVIFGHESFSFSFMNAPYQSTKTELLEVHSQASSEFSENIGGHVAYTDDHQRLPHKRDFDVESDALKHTHP